jgi:glycosyltransferase involved in cell wall biosynthesis
MLPGRLTRWKGQTVLIDALARMARRDAVGVLVGAEQGHDRYSRGLLEQAARLGVAVRMVGHCEDMPAALMLADVVVNASTKPEAFGRVVIEAQAMGRPVIATDHGGAVETVEHGDTGWRVPSGDAGALAASLDHVLSLSPERLEAFGARARASVRANYTVARMQAATLDVYREVLEQHAEAQARAQPAPQVAVA